MMLAPFDYAAPETLEKAVELLQRNPEARLLAGGQHLLTAMKLHRITPSMLIDLGKIAALRGIRRGSDGGMRIGAMTSLTEMVENHDLREAYSALVETATHAGDPQMRNVSTLGGELASDGSGTPLPAAILAFDATLRVFGPEGTRTITASDDGGEAYKMDGVEIITAIELPPVGERSGSAYEAFRDRASGRAICGVAASISIGLAGELQRCRIAVIGTGRRAARLTSIEEALQGRHITAETIKTASRASYQRTLHTDRAASAEYKAFLIGVLAERVLRRAVASVGYTS